MTNILVVDVNATTSYRIRKLLEPQQIEIHSATTFNEGINRLTNPSYEIDMVLIDVKLGPENGFDLIQKFREINENVLVVIVTSLNTRQSFVQGIKVGAVDYILKPYDEAYLKSKLLGHICAIEKSKSLPEVSPQLVDQMIYSAIRKAIREEYEVLIGLMIIYHKTESGNEGVNIRDMAILKTLLNEVKESVGPDDVLLTQGANGIIVILPRKNLQLKESISSYYRKLCDDFLLSRNLSETSIALDFINLPNEVDPSQNALSVLAHRIEKILL